MSYLAMMTGGQGALPAAGHGTESPLLRVVAEWPPVWREAFEERAAIMEYEGGLPHAEAERLAEQCVRRFAAQVEGLLEAVGGRR